MSPELKGIREDIKQLGDKVTAGFEKMNGRVKKLELDNAREEGRRSIMVSQGSVDWPKVTLSLAKSLGIGLGIAYLIAQWWFSK